MKIQNEAQVEKKHTKDILCCGWCSESFDQLETNFEKRGGENVCEHCIQSEFENVEL